LCHNKQEATEVFKRAIELNLPINTPITYDEFLDRQFYRGKGKCFDKGVLINNIEIFLAHLSHLQVIAFTMNEEGEKVMQEEQQPEKVFYKPENNEISKNIKNIIQNIKQIADNVLEQKNINNGDTKLI
jgi:hypothetical protein